MCCVACKQELQCLIAAAAAPAGTSVHACLPAPPLDLVLHLRFSPHLLYLHLRNFQVYLNLVLEYVPDTVYRINKHYTKNEQRMPIILVKLYTYQMLRALAHIHCIGVCHR